MSLPLSVALDLSRYLTDFNAIFSNRETDPRGGFTCVIHAYLVKKNPEF